MGGELAVRHHARLCVQASRTAGMLSSVESMHRFHMRLLTPPHFQKQPGRVERSGKFIGGRRRKRQTERGSLSGNEKDLVKDSVASPNKFFGIF